MIKELVLKNRTYRRFEESHKIEKSFLKELIELARFSPSAANLQPLKFLLSCTPEKNNRIFPHLAWAGYLKNWKGPEPGERPSAYIIILNDTRISKRPDCDHGIVVQSMLLGAVEKGLGGCIFGAVQRQKLSQEFKLPVHLEILLVLALGKPREAVILEDAETGKNIKYWRDAEQRHHVPKRTLDEIILEL